MNRRFGTERLVEKQDLFILQFNRCWKTIYNFVHFFNASESQSKARNL